MTMHCCVFAIMAYCVEIVIVFIPLFGIFASFDRAALFRQLGNLRHLQRL